MTRARKSFITRKRKKIGRVSHQTFGGSGVPNPS